MSGDGRGARFGSYLLVLPGRVVRAPGLREQVAVSNSRCYRCDCCRRRAVGPLGNSVEFVRYDGYKIPWAVAQKGHRVQTWRTTGGQRPRAGPDERIAHGCSQSEVARPMTGRCPIPQTAISKIENFQEGGAEASPWRGSTYADTDGFAREDGSPIPPERVTNRLTQLSRTGGLRAIRWHDLRHGRASLMLAADIPMAVASTGWGIRRSVTRTAICSPGRS